MHRTLGEMPVLKKGYYMFGECKKHPEVELQRKYYGGKYAEYCPECRKELFCNAIMEKVESISRTDVFGVNGHNAQQSNNTDIKLPEWESFENNIRRKFNAEHAGILNIVIDILREYHNNIIVRQL